MQNVNDPGIDWALIDPNNPLAGWPRQYRKWNRKYQEAVRKLERSQPNMPDDERLRLAVTIALNT
jgi:hypothetical protein